MACFFCTRSIIIIIATWEAGNHPWTAAGDSDNIRSMLGHAFGHQWTLICHLVAAWAPDVVTISTKIQWKSLKINENRWKSMKINENQWNPMKINEIQWNLLIFIDFGWRRRPNWWHERPWGPRQVHPNACPWCSWWCLMTLVAPRSPFGDDRRVSGCDMNLVQKKTYRNETF